MATIDDRFDFERCLPFDERTATGLSGTKPPLPAVYSDKAVNLSAPDIRVTEEMITLGALQMVLPYSSLNARVSHVYRTMAAVAPVELVSTAEDRVATLETERDVLIWARDQWRLVVEDRDARITELESQVRMLMSDKISHDYLGPIKDGKSVPDSTHEQFHKAVGDVISGNVIRPARDQMEKALADAKAKDSKAPQPIRGITTSGDPRRIGWA